MGYPMSWYRLLARSGLMGGYDGHPRGVVRGDAQRLENDTLDARHLAAYAALVGATERQVAFLFRGFFGLREPGCRGCGRVSPGDRYGRCSHHDVRLVRYDPPETSEEAAPEPSTRNRLPGPVKWDDDGELYLAVDFRLAQAKPEGWRVSAFSVTVDPPQSIDTDALELVRTVLAPPEAR